MCIATHLLFLWPIRFIFHVNVQALFSFLRQYKHRCADILHAKNCARFIEARNSHQQSTCMKFVFTRYCGYVKFLTALRHFFQPSKYDDFYRTVKPFKHFCANPAISYIFFRANRKRNALPTYQVDYGLVAKFKCSLKSIYPSAIVNTQFLVNPCFLLLTVLVQLFFYVFMANKMK